MRLRSQIATGILISLSFIAVDHAQRGGANPQSFPAAQRPAGEAALIARGNALYGVNCRLCHGADLRGGDQGGPNLLRSAVVFDDQAGELIGPVVLNGRSNPGLPPMPKFTLTAEDIRALAEYLHSVMGTLQGQGSPPRGAPVQLNIVVGDAAAGQSYFVKNCATCHSVTGDLQGIGSRAATPTALQNGWLGGNVGGGGGRGGGRGGAGGNGVTVTVTPPAGPKIEGTLGRIDDFIVIVNMADGSSRSIRRDGDVPKVEIRDPRDAHRKLLPMYTDKDIHDVTAYLVTLK
jgi:cytochrome c oxidase cbb3-type subunit 3